MKKGFDKRTKKMLNTDQTKENKIPKTITLDPTVFAWVSQRAGIMKMNGEKANDSMVINDILRAAMEKELAEREAEGMKLIAKKTTNGGKQIKQLRREA